MGVKSSQFFVQSFSGSQVNFFWIPPDSVGSETEARDSPRKQTESQKIIDSKSAGWERGIHMLVPRQVRFVELTCNHFIHFAC